MIRKMIDKDIESVIELELNCFSETLGYEMFKRDLMENIYALYYVYEINDKIVGYVSSWVLSDKAEILNFCVEESFRNKGIGNELLLKIINEIKNLGATNISLEVRESNTNAINLYLKNGFTKEYIRKEYYKNLENAILMIKKM